MKVKITKIQKIVDDKPEETVYRVSLDREYQAMYRSPTNLINVDLFLDEIQALMVEFSEIIKDK